MSCTDCNRKNGCEEHKEPERVLLAATISSVYPSRTWGEPDDQARFGAGLRRSEIRRLGHALAVAARAPTHFREGGPNDLCDFIYVQCVGRAPALIDIRDGLAAAESTSMQEQYLRVAFSTVARMATVQEVALELESEAGDAWVREIPQPGVYDGKLLKRMRSVVDLLRASDIEHIDFGLLDVPLQDSHPGNYQHEYGVSPTLLNFLFYAEPARTALVQMVSVTGALDVQAPVGERLGDVA